MTNAPRLFIDDSEEKVEIQWAEELSRRAHEFGTLTDLSLIVRGRGATCNNKASHVLGHHTPPHMATRYVEPYCVAALILRSRCQADLYPLNSQKWK